MDVRGDDNRIAGRDYYERPTIITGHVPAGKPGLTVCPDCERPGLSRSAPLCPECGHDFTIARRKAYERLQGRRLLVMATAAASLATGAGVAIWPRSHFGSWQAWMLLCLWVMVGLAWLGHWVHARRTL